MASESNATNVELDLVGSIEQGAEHG